MSVENKIERFLYVKKERADDESLYSYDYLNVVADLDLRDVVKSYIVKSLVVYSLLLFPLRASADTAKLTGQEIKETFSEASLKLDTPFGTTLPIYFKNDGIISGKAGGLASYLGSSEDRGRWWISNDKLCLKWFKWLNSETQCFALQLKDRRVSWSLDNGLKGTATLEDKPTTIKAYLLKAPPQRAQRHALVPSMPLEKRYADAATSLFSLGIPLSQALMKRKNDTKTHGGANIPSAPQTSVSLNSEKVQIQTVDTQAADQPNEIDKIKGEENPANKILGEQDTTKNKVLSEKYLTVAGVEEGDTLNIRSGPSPDQSIIGAIPQNSKRVKLLGPCQNFWCRVQFRNVNGWVSKYYLAENSTKDGSFN